MFELIIHLTLRLYSNHFIGLCYSSDRPLEFDLSDRLLERQYKSIQRQLHPDLHSSGSKQQRLYSEQRSSEVNEAYNILLDPLKRAKLLVCVQTSYASHFLTLDVFI